jgi:hypothetical protein
MESSTTLCAFDWSFAAGLIEALTWVACEKQPVLLVAYDAPYPEPLRAFRPIAAPFALALMLNPARTDRSIAELALDFASAPTGPHLPAGLTLLLDSIPAARGLPLLGPIAKEDRAEIALEYIDGRRLRATVAAL